MYMYVIIYIHVYIHTVTYNVYIYTHIYMYIYTCIYTHSDIQYDTAATDVTYSQPLELFNCPQLLEILDRLF